MSALDVVIIGAGAAGLGAARTARAHGLAVTLIEAKDRIGGRAWTDLASLGVPWERGANWLHNAETNPFRQFADEAGFVYETVRPPARSWVGGDGRATPHGRESGDRAASDPPERLGIRWPRGWASPELHAAEQAYAERAFRAVAAAGAADSDVAAAEVIPPDPRFAPTFEPWFAAVVGVEPVRMSTVDFARADDSGRNLRLEAGYGRLVAHVGRAIPIALATPATAIRWGGRDVAVATPRGTLAARAAIVTVSSSVLAAGGIRFDPPLPAVKTEAVAAVPLGEAAKVALAFDANPFDRDAPSFLDFLAGRHLPLHFEIRPFGRDLAIAHLGGRFAREAEAEGPRAMTAFALDALVEVFGAGLRRRLSASATTGWCRDPHVLGGYSCALPGRAHLRPRLAEPLADRLWFAGEACSLDHYGTVHGAWETGVAAARQVAARLGRSRSADATSSRPTGI